MVATAPVINLVESSEQIEDYVRWMFEEVAEKFAKADGYSSLNRSSQTLLPYVWTPEALYLSLLNEIWPLMKEKIVGKTLRIDNFMLTEGSQELLPLRLLIDDRLAAIDADADADSTYREVTQRKRNAIPFLYYLDSAFEHLNVYLRQLQGKPEIYDLESIRTYEDGTKPFAFLSINPENRVIKNFLRWIPEYLDITNLTAGMSNLGALFHGFHIEAFLRWMQYKESGQANDLNETSVHLLDGYLGIANTYFQKKLDIAKQDKRRLFNFNYSQTSVTKINDLFAEILSSVKSFGILFYQLDKTPATREGMLHDVKSVSRDYILQFEKFLDDRLADYSSAFRTLQDDPEHYFKQICEEWDGNGEQDVILEIETEETRVRNFKPRPGRSLLKAVTDYFIIDIRTAIDKDVDISPDFVDNYRHFLMDTLFGPLTRPVDPSIDIPLDFHKVFLTSKYDATLRLIIEKSIIQEDEHATNPSIRAHGRHAHEKSRKKTASMALSDLIHVVKSYLGTEPIDYSDQDIFLYTPEGIRIYKSLTGSDKYTVKSSELSPLENAADYILHYLDAKDLIKIRDLACGFAASGKQVKKALEKNGISSESHAYDNNKMMLVEAGMDSRREGVPLTLHDKDLDSLTAGYFSDAEKNVALLTGNVYADWNAEKRARAMNLISRSLNQDDYLILGVRTVENKFQGEKVKSEYELIGEGLNRAHVQHQMALTDDEASRILQGFKGEYQGGTKGDERSSIILSFTAGGDGNIPALNGYEKLDKGRKIISSRVYLLNKETVMKEMSPHFKNIVTFSDGSYTIFVGQRI